MKIIHFIPQAIGLTLLLFLGIEGVTHALPLDSTTTDPTVPSNEINPLRDGLGGGLNPFDLLHSAELNPSRGSEEFDSDSQKNIQTAAEQFKKQQRQEVQGSGSSTSNEITAPKTISP